ncbi:MAG TPA: hypothetical protein VLJ39_17350 [Tepidisphaeraceae bacterium]|nr:hypothetical protein [Tepidisphaeraceae bacterium]
MNKSILSAAVLSAGLLLGGFAPSSARAADDPNSTPPARRDREPQGSPMLDRVRSILNDLKLSDEQKGKIDKMFADAQDQLKKIREEAKDDRQQAGQKSRELLAKLREDVGSVLNDEQKEQFKQKLQSLTPRGGDVVGRLKSSLERLKLKDDQKQKVKDLLEETQTKAKDLRDKAQSGSEDARQQLRELLQNTREKLGEILTDEQKKELQDNLQQGRPAGDAPADRPKTEKKGDQ